MKNIILLLCLLSGHATIAQIQWQEIATPTTKDLNNIQFISNNVGFACGDSVLLKTIDGGVTWSNMSLDSFPNNINQSVDFLDMHWFDEFYGYVIAGPWGGFYETTDGGQDWEPIGTANAGFCQTSSLFYFDEDNGFAGGGGCFEGHIIDRFSNGTWSTTNDPNEWDTGNWITSIEFKDANVGFAGTKKGTLLRTTDGGLNWDSISSPAGDSAITDFIFYPDGTIRATHQNNAEYGVMISNDGGLSWGFDNDLASFFYPSMNAAHIDQNGTTYIAGETFDDSGLIFDNSGTFWNMLSIDHPINDIASYGDSITFLVGDSGAVYVSVDLLALGVEDEEGIEFGLAPNPATDRIELMGIEGEIEGYWISDLSGRIVFQSKRHSISNQIVDVADLNAGVYLLSIQTPSGTGSKRFLKR